MLGSEGELGHWEMPEKEADMQQKIRDNFQTLQMGVGMLRISKDLKEQFPKKHIVISNKKFGIERFHVDKQAVVVWEGASAGAFNELTADGLYDEAIEVMKATREDNEPST